MRFSRALIIILLALAAALAAPASAEDLGGRTIAPPAPGALNLSNGVVTGSITVRSGSVLKGLTINGDVAFDQDADGVSITYCSFRRIETTKHVSNLTVAGCRISTGIGRGQPFTGISLGNPGNGIVVTDNLFLDCHEGIHLTDGDLRSGLVISYNEFTGIQRHAIEVQCQAQAGLCSNNYAHAWRHNPGDDNNGPQSDSHIGISWACGPNAARTVYSTGCVVRDNVIDFDGETPVPLNSSVAYKVCGLEWMGHAGDVSGNWIRNAGLNAYTWTNGFTSRNNVWIGYNRPGWTTEPGSDMGGRPGIINDLSFGLNDPNAPARPTNVGPRVTPGPAGSPVITPSVDPATRPAAPAFAATSPGGGVIAIRLASPLAAPAPLTCKSRDGADPVVTLATLAAGTQDVRIGGVPPTWVIRFGVGDVIVGATATNTKDGPAVPNFVLVAQATQPAPSLPYTAADLDNAQALIDKLRKMLPN
jgi:hypothetical protein